MSDSSSVLFQIISYNPDKNILFLNSFEDQGQKCLRIRSVPKNHKLVKLTLKSHPGKAIVTSKKYFTYLNRTVR